MDYKISHLPPTNFPAESLAWRVQRGSLLVLGCDGSLRIGIRESSGWIRLFCEMECRTIKRPSLGDILRSCQRLDTGQQYPKQHHSSRPQLHASLRHIGHYQYSVWPNAAFPPKFSPISCHRSHGWTTRRG